MRKVKTTCQAYKRADEGINERLVLLESLWVKVETQLGVLAKISGHLTNELLESQLNLLQRLKGRLAQAASQLEAVNPKSIENKGRATDVVRKWKFALVKSTLDELMAELEAWQQRFDPSWYLMILISGTVLDKTLVEFADSNSRKSNRDSGHLTKMLAIRSTLNPDLASQRKSHISLNHDGLKDAQASEIAFTAARSVKRAGSTDLLIVQRVSCPS